MIRLKDKFQGYVYVQKLIKIFKDLNIMLNYMVFKENFWG